MIFLKFSLDIVKIFLYNNTCKEVMQMEHKPETKEDALQMLLRIIADNPDVADRITITIKPNKVLQGSDKKRK